MSVCLQKPFSADAIQRNLFHGLCSKYSIRTCVGIGHDASYIFDKKICLPSKDNNAITIWDLQTNQCSHILKGYYGGALSFAVFEDKLYSACTDNTVKIWDLNTEKFLGTLQGHQDSVTSVVASKNGLHSCSDDRTVKTWDSRIQKCVKTFQGHKGGVTSLALLGDNTLYSGGKDKVVKIWDSKQQKCVDTLIGHEDSVSSIVTFGKGVCSGSWDKTVKVWDSENGECSKTFEGNPGRVLGLDVIDEGKLRVTFPKNKTMVWDFTGEPSAILNELARLFKSGKNANVEEAMAQFSNLDSEIKNKIYGELYVILAPFPNDYFGCAEHDFFGLHGLSATPEQKAEAIERYAASQTRE